MVDNLKKLTASIYELRQFKSCQITAKIDDIDLRNNQLLKTFPLSSEYIFENISVTYKRDRTASDDNYFTYFDSKSVEFPTSEHMVYDTGEDLKAKLKGIITQNQFRN